MSDEHLTSSQAWGDIDLNFTRGTVFFQQKWFYIWQRYTGVTADWTYREKQNFHFRTDRQIWRTWSNWVRLKVRGSNRFVERFRSSGVLINFDVRWVLDAPYHWRVTVYKMPPGSSPTTFISNVNFSTREMFLDSADVNSYNAGGGDFFALPHEFGHTIDNDDEYRPPSVYQSDTNSMMNVGQEIRGRHLRLILRELNKMIPNCEFYYN